MQTCQECGKESKYVVCTECFNKEANLLNGDGCHNCDKPCKPCYDFEDDSTQVYNDLIPPPQIVVQLGENGTVI